MGVYAVSVEKETQFRNQTERFSNIYHYSITAPVPGDYENLANAVVDRDRAAYPSAVAFKQVRVWGPVEGPAGDNKMRFEGPLAVNGTRTASATAMYPELCVVVSTYVGRSPVHNRKIFVRKYIRYIRAMDGTENPADPALATTTKNFFRDWMAANHTITRNAVSYAMVTPKGTDVPDAEVPKVLNYLHIRQIKQ